MASASRNSNSPVRSFSTSFDSDDSVRPAVESYPRKVSSETLEKSFTNLNVHLSSIAYQREELTRSFKEFAANFSMQQEILDDEIKLVRIEMGTLRMEMNGSS